ncbi:daunorubicin resistance protein DrrA family ABC transporter ATP-binding protein [Marinimicrobium sp. LS-A18]|uniref:daunorubicin resistance protein DrrA family ABC transporter ATP-binding protein n=1 Tax=Marinimicrobium sp. LS-A18 TaxID=1381596 RepID=UPI0004659F94|nr:daunorubicin resistance protein DrrA family ABC transporter ATP-binding protein [Marinimicrobium sp. LS-A18]
MDSTPDFAIETRGLRKAFGSTLAVRGIDLQVKRGSVYGLLGPNGAGKTTTVRMLSTLLPPSGGEARVLGHDLVHQAEQVRARISLTGQFASVDEDLSGRENLTLLARLQGFSWLGGRVRADTLLKAFDLQEAARRQVKTYSGGMRRRLDIAASLIITPDLLFLDEPTTGLDPRSRNQVWDIVRGLVDDGTTVLLTTQYLEEADQLAERIAVIDQGAVIAEGTSRELKASVGSNVLHLQLTDPAQREQAQLILAGHLDSLVHLEADPASLTVQLSDSSEATRALAELPQAGIGLNSFSMGQPSLDEVFLSLTGHTVSPQNDPEEASQ